MRSHGHEGSGLDPQYRDADYLKTLGYERRDVAIPSLAKWITGLFVFIFGALVLAWGTYFLFVSRDTELRRSLPQTAMERDVPRNLPKIQAYPRRDMVLFRREEEKKVDGYGWVDQQKGVAYVPVETAIEQLAQEGFSGPGGAGPARGAAQTEERTRTQPPGPSHATGTVPPPAAAPGPQPTPAPAPAH